MKRTILIMGMFLAGATAFVACEKQNEPSPKQIEKPFVKDDAYWANLRSYKQISHEIAFGWFGGWTASGAGMSTRLANAPDSMDVITIWGDPNLTDAMRADMKLVQQRNGTKVCFTMLLSHVGKGFPAGRQWPHKDYGTDGQGQPIYPTQAQLDVDTIAIASYGEAIAQELVIARGYDGYDIDYEPTIGGAADVAGCPRGENMKIFIRHLAKFIGPMSPNPNLLLIIDGQLDLSNDHSGMAKYYSYCVSQAYNATSDSGLQTGRFNNYVNAFKKAGEPDLLPSQFVVTENFESNWSTGGPNYTSARGGIVPSLLGMAYWVPTQGRKGGCGSYHMEYEYMNTSMEYKYMRKAIQIMNPAVR